MVDGEEGARRGSTVVSAEDMLAVDVDLVDGTTVAASTPPRQPPAAFGCWCYARPIFRRRSKRPSVATRVVQLHIFPAPIQNGPPDQAADQVQALIYPRPILKPGSLLYYGTSSTPTSS